jgi:hypothetical protein
MEVVMALPVRTRSTYSISAAAHEIGCSTHLLRKLEAQGVITPARHDDRRRARIYTDADLEKVVRYYEAKGGIRRFGASVRVAVK